VDPGAEGEHALAAAVGGDVEGVGGDAVSVGVPRGHEHDRAGREGHAPVLELGGGDARRERGDRLKAQGLVDGRQGEAVGIGAQPLPPIGVAGEQPDGVGEPALAGVDAADEHVHPSGVSSSPRRRT
jgi:hypothetical protein